MIEEQDFNRIQIYPDWEKTKIIISIKSIERPGGWRSFESVNLTRNEVEKLIENLQKTTSQLP